MNAEEKKIADRKAKKAAADKKRREALKAKTAVKKAAPSLLPNIEKTKLSPRDPVALAKLEKKGHGGKRASSGNKPGWSGVKTTEALLVVSFRGTEKHKEKASRLGAQAIRDWLDSQPMPRAR